MLDLVERVKVVEVVSKDGGVRRQVDLKLYDAQGALRLLGRAHGLFMDRVAVEEEQETVQFTIEDLTRAVEECQTEFGLAVGSPDPTARGIESSN
jgi:hypothetical protein